MVSGTTVSTTAPGTCAITASQGGDSTYAPAPDVRRSFQVHAGYKPQTITFRQPPGVRAGVPATLLASATSGLPVLFGSDTPKVCTVQSSTVVTLAHGTCTITASQGGSAVYAPAPNVQRSFPVNPVTSKATWVLVILLTTLTLLAGGGAALAVHRLWPRSRPPSPTPIVRAVPHNGPTGRAEVHKIGTEPDYIVHIAPHPGTSTTTLKETRP
jgi:hypothetical protein